MTAGRADPAFRRGSRCPHVFALGALALTVGCAWASGAPDDADIDVDVAVDGRPPGTPALRDSRQLCKLINDRHVSDPTPNDLQFRSNVLGADLGIPVEAGGQLFIMFGDTIGFAGIWGGGQSHPDSIGFAMDSAAAVADKPELLCTRMGIVSLPASSSLGPTIDARVQADFAGVAMIAPDGRTLGEFIRNPAGAGDTRFLNLPGDFEVPSGAFSYGGAIYVFYTTVGSTTDVTMKGSYLARWDTPAKAGIPSFQILYAVDQRFDDQGALYGDFINISATVAGEYVYLFGTGAFRASPVRLARKRLDTLATPGGFELYDAASQTWSTKRGAPIIEPPGFGETSTRYFADLGRWMFLAEELRPGSNRIVARFADRPEGPWEDPIVVHDMADPAFLGTYCCGAENACEGPQFMHCNRTGFYGAYLFPTLSRDGNTFEVTYTMSSFDPYNVALFATTFELR